MVGHKLCGALFQAKHLLAVAYSAYENRQAVVRIEAVAVPSGDNNPLRALARNKLELTTPSDLAVHAAIPDDRMPYSVCGGEKTVDHLGQVQLYFIDRTAS
jgi:hypothetical protein